MEFLIPLSFGVVTALITFAVKSKREATLVAGWGLIGTFVLCILCI